MKQVYYSAVDDGQGAYKMQWYIDMHGNKRRLHEIPLATEQEVLAFLDTVEPNKAPHAKWDVDVIDIRTDR